MKIYTGTGDQGKTSLFSGERVLKNSLRIEAYGSLDELNSTIGAVLAALENVPNELGLELESIQKELLDAGAWLATTPNADSIQRLIPFTKKPAEHLESAIDRMSVLLPELRGFILPGGNLAAALAHMARTVCRRAERRVIDLDENQTDSTDTTDSIHNILVYLNRLSDYLFVLARYCNHLQKRGDTLWRQ